MPTICYELGNYYLILTNIVLNVHAFFTHITLIEKLNDVLNAFHNKVDVKIKHQQTIIKIMSYIENIPADLLIYLFSIIVHIIKRNII